MHNQGNREVALLLGLNPATLEARRDAFDLAEKERGLLAELADEVASGSAAFVDRLYRRLRETPETAEWLRSDALVERLRREQLRYLDDLFRAPIDWPYVQRRLAIGVTHHRIRLAPQWYLATYAHFVCDHLDVALEHGLSHLVSLVKSVFFDASLTLDAYGCSQAVSLWTGSRQATHADVRAAVRESRPPKSPRPAHFARIQLTSDRPLARRRFIGLDDQDARELAGLRALIADVTPGMLDEFYRFVGAHPEMARLLAPESVDRLKKQVASYWGEVATAAFDRPYAASRLRIGVIHEKLGLEPQWYLAGMSRQVVSLLRAIAAAVPNPRRAMSALLRAVFFDLSFVLDAYMEARADSLVRTEGYANQLVASLSSAVAVLDGRGRLVSANPTLLSLAGADPSVLYLMAVADVLPIPELPRLIAECRESGARRVGFGRMAARSFRITVSSLSDDQLTVGSSIAVMLDDVTDVMRVGQELDRDAGHFALMADAVGAVLFEMDAESETIHAINRAALDLTGYPDTHFLGRPGAWSQLVAEDDRPRLRQMLHAVKDAASAELETRMQRRDGATIWVRTRLRRDGEHVIGVAMDVTVAHRSAQLRLEALSRLAGGVAHVVNNSLTGVTCGIELHAEKQGGIESTPMLREALESAGKAGAMAQRLLSFARGQVLAPEVVSLSVETRAALSRLTSLLGPGVELQLDLAPDLWRCRVDRRALVTAWECLVDNARNAMFVGNGVVRITTKNLPDDGERGDQVEWRLTDNGVGMPEEVRARAIEPFFSTRALTESSGLGLSMAHGLVSQSGGALSLESAPGGGTTVCLRLPRDREPEVAPVSTRVLLVEDEASVRKLTAASIRWLGYDVYDTGSVEEAVRLAGEIRPQILVADVILEQSTDGVGLAARLCGLDPTLSVILVSGYPQPQLSVSGLPSMTQFLPKPFSVQGLKQCLSYAEWARNRK